jgi:hypothetical protein
MEEGADAAIRSSAADGWCVRFSVDMFAHEDDLIQSSLLNVVWVE